MKKILKFIKGYILYKLHKGKSLFPIFIANNKVGNNVFIGRNSHIEDCIIGTNTYFGNNCCIHKAKIGNYCSIAIGVTLISGRHPTQTFVSTSPLFYSKFSCLGRGFYVDDSFEEYSYTNNGYALEIGNDVWIGANVTILDGIRIGDGAVIAACSCVTKDVPPYAIVGGVPAKIIRYRFPEDQVKSLLKIKWWELPEDMLHEYAIYFSNVTKFVTKLCNIDKYNE